MKTRRILSILFLAFALVAAACSDDGTNGEVVKPVPPTNNTDDGDVAVPDAGSDAADVADVDSSDACVGLCADVGEDTGRVITVPGFMHGTWIIKEGDTTLATLNLAHEQGQTTLTGTFDMEAPVEASGTLGGTTWRNDSIFTTSWFADVNGSDRQFGITQAQRGEDDDVFSDARFIDGTTGGFRTVTLTRQ